MVSIKCISHGDHSTLLVNSPAPSWPRILVLHSKRSHHDQEHFVDRLEKLFSSESEGSQGEALSTSENPSLLVSTLEQVQNFTQPLN